MMTPSSPISLPAIRGRSEQSWRLYATLGALLALPLSAEAHFFSESPDCRAPAKPLTFATDADRSAYQQEVESYKSCLETFINKQNAAMEKHNQAAVKANDLWTRYVEKNLKSEGGS